MATFDINEVARRAQSTSTGQTAFTFNFQVNAASEIQVYVDDTLKELSTHYTVALNADGTGTVNFGSATSSGELITIIGDQPLSRTTSFQVGQVNNPTTLETEFDNLTIRQQQLKEMMDRSIQLKPSTKRTVTGTGTSGPLQFPYDATASNNANKIVKFDSNGTALELGSTTTNIDTLAGVSTEIALLGTSGNVTAMGLLGTSAVVADMALLGTSDVIADMALLADSAVIADMAILATTDVVSDLNTLATSDIVTDINLLATSDIVSDLNTLATSDIVSDLNTLATSDIVSDINTLATSDVVSDLNTLATSDFVSDLNTLASSTVVANIATVASNVAGVNSFAARYRVGSSDPSSDNDAGDLAFNTTSNTLKFFDGSSYNAIATTFSIDAASDTNLSSPADGALLLYDTGTSKFIDNVVSGDATLADTGALTIANNAVTTAKINADAVTGAKIADDAIDSEHYTDGSIDTAHIADAQVTTAKIADNAITLAKMASGTDGNIISFDASGNPVAVATGSAGQILTSAGAGAPPTFATLAGGGGTEFIVSSGAISNAASVTFTQFDASKYDHYAFYFQHVIPVNDNVVLFGYHSTDGGSSFDTTSGDYSGNTNAFTGFQVSAQAGNVGSDTNEFGVSGIAHLIAPHLAAFTTMVTVGIATQDTNGDIIPAIRSNGGTIARLAAEDTDAIKFAFSAGNIESGEITMFGIVNS